VLCVCAGRVIISRRCLHTQISASSLLFAPLPKKARSVLQRRSMPCCLDQERKIVERSHDQQNWPGGEEKKITKRRQTPVASVPQGTSFPVSCLAICSEGLPQAPPNKLKEKKRLLARFAMLVLPKHAVLCPASDATETREKTKITHVVIRMREQTKQTHKSTDSRVVVYDELRQSKNGRVESRAQLSLRNVSWSQAENAMEKTLPGTCGSATIQRDAMHLVELCFPAV